MLFCESKGCDTMLNETTEAIDADEWLHTDNRPAMSVHSYAELLGPAREVLSRADENLYTARITAFLLSHPKVAEVQVIGVPDPVMGEELLALLKLKPGVQASVSEIRAYCREVISKHNIPRYLRLLRAGSQAQTHRMFRSRAEKSLY